MRRDCRQWARVSYFRIEKRLLLQLPCNICWLTIHINVLQIAEVWTQPDLKVITYRRVIHRLKLIHDCGISQYIIYARKSKQTLFLWLLWLNKR